MKLYTYNQNTMLMKLFRSTESLDYKKKARDKNYWKKAQKGGGALPTFLSPYSQKYDSLAVMYQGP